MGPSIDQTRPRLQTAAKLHRPPTGSSPTMASPRVDPQSLVTLVSLAVGLCMLVGMVTVVG
jgi:hypothetical protein